MKGAQGAQSYLSMCGRPGQAAGQGRAGDSAQPGAAKGFRGEEELERCEGQDGTECASSTPSARAHLPCSHTNICATDC